MKASGPVDVSHQVRRRNRVVADETWIREFLRSASTCFLATVSDGQPFLNANLFLYDAGKDVVYVHTAGTGRTRANIEADPRVCLAVAEMGRLLPGEKITDYSTEYASVILFGRATVVAEPEEVRYALQNQADKYFPHLKSGRDYVPFTDEESARTAVYRIEIEEWSAKCHEADPHHPGAFWPPRGFFKQDPG